MLRRIIDVYYDVAGDRFLDASGNQLGRGKFWPFVYFKEKPLMRLRLVDGDVDTAYVKMAIGSTYTAAIDDDFNHASTLLCKTENTGINVDGDWETDDSSGVEDSSGNGSMADPEAGEFSIQLNANTLSFETAIGSSVKQKAYFELTAFTGGGDRIAIVRFPVILKNLVDDDGDSPIALSSGASNGGTVSIGSGVSSVTVSGLALTYTPTGVIVGIRKPDSSGLNIFASVRTDSITSDGFIVDLSGQTDSADYDLDYLTMYF